jgi:hypothetical protein
MADCDGELYAANTEEELMALIYSLDYYKPCDLLVANGNWDLRRPK